LDQNQSPKTREDLSPEDQAKSDLSRCIGCAHRASSNVDPDRIDWPLVVREAVDVWLGGLLLEAVERHRWALPTNCLGLVREQALRIRHSNRMMMSALPRIVGTLYPHDVQVVLLKGAALNLTQYDRPDLRPMSDLDLWVHPEDADRARKALEHSGYRRGAGLVRDDFFPRFHYEVEYLSNDTPPVRLDLHAQPFRPLRYAQTVSSQTFWDRSQSIERDGMTVKVLADEEQFIHLATHSACHGHERLLWLYDMLRLLERAGDAFDWDRVVKQCGESRLTLPVRHALQAVENHWGPVCPDGVRTHLQSERVDWKDRLCLSQAPRDADQPVAHVAVNLLCTRGLRFRLGYLAAMLFPNRQHMGSVYARRHPGWLCLAHLRRFARAIRRIPLLFRLPRLGIA
jgi:hypothetical protein